MKYYKHLYKYELAEDVIIHLVSILPKKEIEHEFFNFNVSGRLLIRKGYRWDGPSGPTVDSKSTLIASMVHDVGYQMTRDGHFSIDEDRALWDKIYRELLIANGTNQARAWGHWYALRKFGWHAAEPKKDEIYEV